LALDDLTARATPPRLIEDLRVFSRKAARHFL